MGSLEEPIIFSTSDPLGRVILLKQSTWDEHIADRHDEKGISEIKENIENPSCIIENEKQSSDGGTRHVYFKFTTLNSKLYINKTVVEFKEEKNEGEIVTNYVLRKINESITEGGVIYVSQPNQNSNTTKPINI